MNKSILAYVPSFLMMLAAFLFFFVPSPVDAVTTIIGWNVPNGTTFNNGLELLIFPLVGMGLFVSLPLILGRKGDFVVTMALLGLFLGSIFGMLTITLTGTGSTGVIPFGVAIETGLLFAIWMWRGSG